MGMFQSALGDVMSGASKMIYKYKDLQTKQETAEQLKIANEQKAKDKAEQDARLAEREARLKQVADAKSNYYQTKTDLMKEQMTSMRSERRRQNKLNNAKVAEMNSKTEKRNRIEEEKRIAKEKAEAMATKETKGSVPTAEPSTVVAEPEKTPEVNSPVEEPKALPAPEERLGLPAPKEVKQLEYKPSDVMPEAAKQSLLQKQEQKKGGNRAKKPTKNRPFNPEAWGYSYDEYVKDFKEQIDAMSKDTTSEYFGSTEPESREEWTKDWKKEYKEVFDKQRNKRSNLVRKVEGQPFFFNDNETYTAPDGTVYGSTFPEMLEFRKLQDENPEMFNDFVKTFGEITELRLLSHDSQKKTRSDYEAVLQKATEHLKKMVQAKENGNKIGGTN